MYKASMSTANSQCRTPVPGFGLLLYPKPVFLSTMAVAAADWADHIAFVPVIGMAGVFVGALIARSRFGGVMALVIGTVYGVFATGALLAETLDLAFVWRERLLILLSRFWVFLTVVSVGLPNQDPLMVVAWLCLLYWAIAVFGAWVLFRRRAVRAAVVPMGLGLFLNALYYIGSARLDLLLAEYLMVALLLILYQEIRRREVRWQAVRARIPARAIGCLIRVDIFFSLSLVVLVWAGPAFAESEQAASVWTRISDPWRAARDRLGTAVSGSRSPVIVVAD